MPASNANTQISSKVADAGGQDWRTLFCGPFNRWSLRQLSEHYHKRQSVRYFPVAEPEHTARKTIDAVLNNRFTFNGESHQFRDGVSWKRNPSRDIEWLILLHKGYYHVGLGMAFRESRDHRYLNKWMELTQSWIDQVEPGFIASDVTGRRIQNWIFAFYYFVSANPSRAVPPDFLLQLLRSLHQQVDYLIDNLTPARNHRTLELYAIFLAAVVFPEFRDAKKWLAFSKNALVDNVRTDILPDGVHCELSTFYHHIVLKNLLAISRLATINGIDFPSAFDERIRRALDFSAHVHRPDGHIPSLSDGDSGCFFDLLKQGYQLYGEEHLRYISSSGKEGRPPAKRSVGFADSGYYILRSPWENDQGSKNHDARYLVFDCGPLGAGSHGHLDLLNIEMAAYGRSLIVDPGRYTYDEQGDINWRVLFRGTGYHNTIQVDGKNQARYEFHKRRNKFKIVGPPAVSEFGGFVSSRHFDYLHGIARSHEYTAKHQRKVFFACGEYWLVVDILDDEQSRDYTLRFHLSQDAQGNVSHTSDKNVLMVDAPGLRIAQPQASATNFYVEPGYISPVYGTKLPAPILRFDRCCKSTVFETFLIPYKEKVPLIELTNLNADSGSEQPNSSLRCRLQSGQHCYEDFYFISHSGEAESWRYERISCHGDFCFLRFDDEGKLLRAFALPGSEIFLDDEPVDAEAGAR